MPSKARFRIHGHGQVEIELIAAYLTDLEYAYNSILAFGIVTDSMGRALQQLTLVKPPFGLFFGWPLSSRQTAKFASNWPPTAKHVASIVPRSQQLVLSSVNLGSPGFWEFLGALNPLEAIRKYLNDGHERRKDRDYRESAERRRLNIENFARESEAILAHCEKLKQFGVTNEDLAPLLNELIYRPLAALDHYQDKDVIENAEVLLPTDRGEIHDQTNYDS
jgi:hypothetical protein